MNQVMDRNAEFVREIERLCHAADENKFRAERFELSRSDDRPGEMLIFDRADGTHRVRVEDRAPRKYFAYSIEGIVGFLEVFSREPHSRGRMSVFVSEANISVLLDESDGRETVVFPLSVSPAWRELVRMANVESGAEEVWYGQREFIDVLRVGINPSPVVPADLVSIVRQLVFKSGGDGVSEIRAGKESLGKSMIAEMSGLSTKIPEDVELGVSVYDNVHIGGALVPARVRCDLATRVSEGLFRLTPLAGEIQRCRTEALDAIVGELKRRLDELKLLVPVFAGSFA